MKLSRCSRGITVLTVVLALFAFFFDTLPAAIASGALIFFLTVRAIIFLSALSSGVSSVHIQRTLSTLLVRQGSPVVVQTEVGITVPPGFFVEISDLPPQKTVLSSGTTTLPLQKGNSSFCNLNYTFTSLDSGKYSFEGIRISLSDPFFSTELVYQTPEATTPSIVILPSTEFAHTGKDPYGEKEVAGLRVLQNPEVRSFRKYLLGDDLRKIDWKLSAKFDTLYIREHAGRTEDPTILIIDLPDAALPFSTDAFSSMREKALSAIVTLTLSRWEFSILFISGPNLISFKPDETDIQWLVVLMNQLAPFPRLHHMYRYSSTASLKRRFLPLIGSGKPFSRTLFLISSAFLSHRPSTTFESQVAYAFRANPVSSVHIFTLANRDASHIQIISEEAANRDINLQIHIPKEALDPPAWARISRNLAPSIEVI